MTHSPHAGCSCVNSILSRAYHHWEGAETPDLSNLKPHKIKPNPQGDTTYFLAEKIYTLDPEKPQARAVKVSGDRIEEVYDQNQWDALTTGPRAAEVKEKTVELSGILYPGFYESHMHPLLDGLLQNGGTDLRDVFSEAQMIAALNQRVPAQVEGNTLVLGYNVDPLAQDPIATDTWLEALDRVGPEKDRDKLYVLVEHNSMHIWYVNTNLLNAIFETHPDLAADPHLEVYFPKKNGRFTGVVQEDTGIAALLTTLHSAQLVVPSAAMLENAAKAFALRAHNRGCTTIADAMTGSVAGDLATYLYMTQIKAPAEFPIRMVIHPFFDAGFTKQILAQTSAFNHTGLNPYLEFGAIKYVVDGSLQGGTAYNPPYRKEGFDKYFNGEMEGVLNLTQEQLEWRLRAYKPAGTQPMIHANSTAAIQIAIDALKAVYSDDELQGLRPRIEHCQVATSRQLETMAACGIQANFLINHVFYWGEIYYNELLPPAVAESISPAKTAGDFGIKPVLHSDAYVSPLDPLRLIWTAVNRFTGKQGKSTGRVLNPSERISVEEALKGVTLYAARLDFAEDVKGSIEPGKFADFTLLGGDLFQMEPDQILGTEVRGTVLGGSFIPCIPEMKASAGN